MNDDTYRARVLGAIRSQLFARWPPRTDAERTQLERNAQFFTQFDYDEADADGRTLEEVADDEIDAAMDLS